MRTGTLKLNDSPQSTSSQWIHNPKMKYCPCRPCEMRRYNASQRNLTVILSIVLAVCLYALWKTIYP